MKWPVNGERKGNMETSYRRGHLCVNYLRFDMMGKIPADHEHQTHDIRKPIFKYYFK